MIVAHVEYDLEPLKGKEKLEEYAKGIHGELVPKYYTKTKLQFKNYRRMTIKCFGCGGPHKKVDFPNHITPA